MARPMWLHANAAVDSQVDMALHREPNERHCISIMFGDEDVMLDFFDAESLERLRDLADEGARRLREEVL